MSIFYWPFAAAALGGTVLTWLSLRRGRGSESRASSRVMWILGLWLLGAGIVGALAIWMMS